MQALPVAEQALRIVSIRLSNKQLTIVIPNCTYSYGSIFTPPARRVWRSYKFAPFLFFFHVERWATAHG